MKRKSLIACGLALFASATYLAAAASDGPLDTAVAEPPTASVEAAAPTPCPPGTVTVEGCIDEFDGCTFVDTINGRTIYVNLTSVAVGPGDVALLTGFFVTDADCDDCVLKVTSATDLGDC
ncbi:MAG: hypothetical protein AAF682_13440 [Planctomycetota bacterium]